MEIGPLLVEQRRVGDEFRIVEEAIQQMHRTLAGRRLDAATRSQIEGFVISTTTELIRLGKRQLDLDASVCAANARAKLRISDEKADLQGSQCSAAAVAKDMRQQPVPSPIGLTRNRGNAEQRALSNAVSDLDSRD